MQLNSTTRDARLEYAFTLGVAAMEGRGFYYPVDIGLGENGRLYVLGRSHEGDTRGIQVCMMDADSEFYGTFGSVGQADGQFIWTTAIVIDSDVNRLLSAMVFLPCSFPAKLSTKRFSP